MLLCAHSINTALVHQLSTHRAVSVQYVCTNFADTVHYIFANCTKRTIVQWIPIALLRASICTLCCTHAQASLLQVFKEQVVNKVKNAITSAQKALKDQQNNNAYVEDARRTLREQQSILDRARADFARVYEPVSSTAIATCRWWRSGGQKTASSHSVQVNVTSGRALGMVSGYVMRDT
jgi:hemerythrin-like domain-containing protein